MKPTTISLLQKCKQEKRRFATITAYDYSFAKLFAEEGITVMLVGDSLGMTVQGHDSTLPVTVEDIAYHTRAVRRGAPACLLLSDLPFMAYATPEQAFENAATVMRAGANMVKIEGGAWLAETVKMLTERAVPVCGHLGLTPQSVNIFGGYKVQGRGDAAQTLFEDALALEAAGAQLLVLECVPVELAKRITEALSIPVIGIGAGNVTDGQILVMHDAFGITGGHIPKFAKNFLAEAGDMRAAVRQYIADVESGVYPDVYPQGTEDATYVDVPGISTMLEGASRPGHFRGVSTIVSKLFNLVQPDVACFGEKDFQQLALIRKMVADMGYDIEIVGVPIVRAKDGLALSSRNGYLTADERKIAPGLSKVMNTMAEQLVAKELSAEEIVALAEQALNDKGFRADDIQIRDADTLLELTDTSKRAVLLVAAWLGQARLIDNKVVELA
nr:unnamed protein product [Digitaria exilis]